tara:strand:+ start:3677 stop:3907 length:231 start_codon:yes stop_codon:yes gene_type:complete
VILKKRNERGNKAMAKEGYHKTKSGKMAKKGLYYYINKKKKEGTSKPKSKSTISDKAYANMKAGFPKKKKRREGLV